MSLGSQRTQIQLRGNLIIGQPATNQSEYLTLTISKLVNTIRALSSRPSSNVGDQPTSNTRRQQSIPPSHDPDGPQQIRRLSILDDKPRSTSPQRLIDVVIGIESRKNKHPNTSQI